VFDTGDSPAEQSQRDLAAFDQKLRRDLPSPDRTAFVDDFEITPQPAPAMLALRRHTPPP
jgi:hypothetical protein